MTSLQHTLRQAITLRCIGWTAACCATAGLVAVATLSRPTIPAPSKPVQVAQKLPCLECGVVESIRVMRVDSVPDGLPSPGVARDRFLRALLLIRMRDGSLRRLPQHRPPAVRIGQPVRIIDGHPVPLG